MRGRCASLCFNVSRGILLQTVGGAVRHTSSASNTIGNAMKMSGFELSTPNFSINSALENVDAKNFVNDLVTNPVTAINFVRDIYGPWLLLTETLQGELFIDHDRMVYLRPANGLGFGVGRIDVADSCATGVVFSLQLESYTYAATSAAPPYGAVTIEATGLVKHVQSASGDYSTYSLVAAWRNKKDGTSGKFNAAKLSPWDPSMSEKPWEPAAELQHMLQQVFPQPLKLTSHLRRSQAAARKAGEENKKGAHHPHHICLEPHRVGDIPDIYYIPEYISGDEEEQIMRIVQQTPKELKTQLTKRTVQEWGCTMCGDCNKSFVSDRNMPQWIDAYNDMLLHDGIFSPSTFPNSVRVHEYQASDCIGAHCDGPIYVPLVAILSLGSPCVMFFHTRREPYDQPMEHYNDTFRFDSGIALEKPQQCVVLEPRSLLVFCGDAYFFHPHGTSNKPVDVLTPDVVGKVVNRHMLKDPEIKEVPKGYRVSVTTRNLLPRCNHQPTRVEYGMKRAWYVYNQLPLPEPLVTASPQPSSFSPLSSSGAEKRTTFEKTSGKTEAKESALAAKDAGNTEPVQLEKKLDTLLAQQSALMQQVGEIRQLIAMESTFRTEMSTVLNHLTSTVLDIDSKLENITQDDKEEVVEKE